MTEQPWGTQQPYGQNPYGQTPSGQNPYGWGPPADSRGFGRSPFGTQQVGMPQYGPRLGMPAPRRRRHPFRLLVLAGIALGLVLMASTTVSNLSSPPSNAAYQNEDYRVPPPDTSPPPLPQPETYEEAEALLTTNPLYDQTVPAPVRCTSQPINVRAASDAQLESHFNGLMECLVRVWQPPVEGAQFEIVRPTVTVYGSSITTRCGKAEVNAFYCGADQQVYYSNRLAESVPIVARDKWAADVVMAHEFAHALQARTAILISSSALGQQTEDEATQLAFSRRLETQADCFSGMFMGAVSESLGIQESDVNGILAVYDAVGDDTLSGNPNVVGNHGRGRSREYWGSQGLGTTEIRACNTYTAPSNLVR